MSEPEDDEGRDYRVLRHPLPARVLRLVTRLGAAYVRKCGNPCCRCACLMPTPPLPPTPPPRDSFDLAAWRPVRRTWLWVLLAFVGGLLLFALVFSGSRNDDLYRADGASPTAASPDYAPLPAPLPANADHNASGLDESGGDPREEAEMRPEAVGRPTLVETAPPPPPAPPAPAAPAPGAPAGPSLRPVPIAGQTPAPRYPMAALRRGESGKVLVRADIGPDGIPTSVSVAQGSGLRALDRAAVEAVRRWRFRPGEIDGQPAGGSVMVPIEFNSR